MQHLEADQAYREKAWQKLNKDATSYIRNIENIPQNSSCTATYHPSRRPSKIDEKDMQDTAGGLRTNS